MNMACVEELLRLAEQRAPSGGEAYSMAVSAYEIYNEQIRDLLAEGDAPPLQLHLQADGRSCLPGLTSLPAPDAVSVQRVLQHVKQRRVTARTNMNASSSRSHSIVQITCVGGCFCSGRLNLVDLAGSERLGRSGSDSDAVALRETQAINGSLSALGDVMQALACKRDHVPYRSLAPRTYCQSPATLGVTLHQEQQAHSRAGRQPATRQQGAHDRTGACSTARMVLGLSLTQNTPLPSLPIAAPLCEQASPDAADAAETICSLTFASRVRGVELNASRRKADAAASGLVAAAAAAAKVPPASAAAAPSSDGKVMSSLRAASTPNIDANKGFTSAAKVCAGAAAARVTPRRLEKDMGQTQVRRSLEKENSGIGE